MTKSIKIIPDLPLSENQTELPYVEKKFVAVTYDQIADDFSRTRYRPWKKTVEFINSLSPYSKVLEVGCGNGKNMGIRTDIIIEGVDVSDKLLDICRYKGYDVKKADGCNLPYNDNEFDAVFSIAVIHHISTMERRKKFMREMIRICKPDGNIMIECWSVSEPRFESGIFLTGDNNHNIDNITSEFGNKLIKFTNSDKTEYMRYYHFFEKNEFEQLMDGTYIEGKLKGTILLDANNWIFTGRVNK